MLKKPTRVEKSDTELYGWAAEGLREESGQVMLEYVLLLAMVSLAIIGVVGVFMGALGNFYLNLVKVMVLPFP